MLIEFKQYIINDQAMCLMCCNNDHLTFEMNNGATIFVEFEDEQMVKDAYDYIIDCAATQSPICRLEAKDVELTYQL